MLLQQGLSRWYLTEKHLKIIRILYRWIALRLVLAVLTLPPLVILGPPPPPLARTVPLPPPPHVPPPGLASWPKGVNGASEPSSSPPLPYPLPSTPSLPQWIARVPPPRRLPRLRRLPASGSATTSRHLLTTNRRIHCLLAICPAAAATASSILTAAAGRLASRVTPVGLGLPRPSL